MNNIVMRNNLSMGVSSKYFTDFIIDAYNFLKKEK